MKLTKDDKKHFLDGDMEWFGSPDDREELWNQILKNQEDAEKYRNQPEIVTLTLKYREIVQRLKKLIDDKKWYGRDATVEELQKILGET